MLTNNADRKAFYKMLISVLLLYTVSCSQASPNPSPIIDSQSATPSITITNTPVSKTLSEQKFTIQTSCVNVNEDILDISKDEVMIIEDIDSKSLYSIQFQANSINKERINIDTEYADFYISPDYKRFIFTSLNPVELVLSNLDVGNTKKFLWKEEWGKIVGWLNNNQIIIIKKADLEVRTYNPKTAITFDVNSGEEKEIDLNFPELNQVNYVNWNFINVAFSQDLTKALYPTSRVTSDYINVVALWNVSEQKTIATLSTELSDTTTPSWSPNGNQVIISGVTGDKNNRQGQELFALDKDGDISQLTFFFDYYKVHINIDQYVWSPDGGKIAFWVTIGRYQTPLLFVLNLYTNTITNYCVSGLPYRATSNLIWSPSGDYLALNYQKTDRDFPSIFLLNIMKGTFSQITEKSEIIGWLLLDP